MKDIVLLHTDTLFRLEREGGKLSHNTFSLSLDKLQNFKSLTTFAFFIPLFEKGVKIDPREKIESMREVQVREFEENKDSLTLIQSLSDYDQNQTNAILSLEEGAVFEGNPAMVHYYRQWGVQMATLTWNFENDLAYPTSFNKDLMKLGLKKKGFEIIEAMEADKMVLDVSHLNDGGISDALQRAKRPVIASHSNCRSLCSHCRNLSDEQIRGIADTGGVVGLNFLPDFVENSENPRTTYRGLTQHLLHLYQTGGEDVLAIGSDFDGIEGDFEPADVSQMGEFVHFLQQNTDLSERILDKVFSRNALRVLFQS